MSAQASGKAALLSEHTRHEIDEWVARFPEGRQRSAVLSALRFAQEQNNGYLTTDLMDAVAEYLKTRGVDKPEKKAEKTAAVQELAWGLLASVEFRFIH